MTRKPASTTGVGPVELQFDAREIVRNLLIVCAGMQILFFTLDFHINWARGSEIGAIRRLFNTASEDSLASWFSIMQTAALAVTLWVIFAVVRKTGSRGRKAGWLILACFFSYLAFDDGAFIHERLGTAYNEYFEDAAAGSLAGWTLELFPSYRWQIVFMPVFAAVGLFMFGFLLRELRGWKPKAVVFVALALLAGAVGLDFFEGLAEDHPLNPYTPIADSGRLDYVSASLSGRSTYDSLLHFSKSVEECTEMFAMTLLWAVFIGHLGWVARDVRVRARQPEPCLTPVREAPARAADELPRAA